jgi:hypothetical protein
MKYLDVDYVLIIFGGIIGYSGDDINKFLWMVRIAEVCLVRRPFRHCQCQPRSICDLLCRTVCVSSALVL